MTLRLRAHHLLCMLTYAGRGYSPAFIENYDRVVARIGAGEEIVLVNGPDDICRPLLDGAAPHCLRASVARRDVAAALALERLLDRPLGPGSALRVEGALLDRMRRAFAHGRTRKACLGCEWSGLCTTIAGEDFRAAALAP